MKKKAMVPFLGEADCWECGAEWIVFSPTGFDESWVMLCFNCGVYAGRTKD